MPETKRLLELFSGTHSIGKVFHKKGYKIVSLDRDLGAKCCLGTDYESEEHIKEDLLKWDYKKYPVGHFDVITASPVCLWWSGLRRTWIGRKCKSIHPTDVITAKHLDDDIDKFGKPMVDKVIEIIEYFKPKYWWIENPQTGRMKHYIEEKHPNYNTYYDVDYCKYSDWGYKKRTRFWTNIKGFEGKKCKNDCGNVVVIKTQKGDKRGKEEIKKDTRTLHLGATCNERNKKSIKKAIDKKEVVQYLHKTNLALPRYIEDDGKVVKVCTKELREKYKDFPSIDVLKHHKKGFGSKIPDQLCVGGGQNRLERYRIPEKLILDFFQKINIL
tara:strand:- start:831 stop:1814 length:984 start_codon:yes stop_codon:yes gene_type:complete